MVGCVVGVGRVVFSVCTQETYGFGTRSESIDVGLIPAIDYISLRRCHMDTHYVLVDVNKYAMCSVIIVWVHDRRGWR